MAVWTHEQSNGNTGPTAAVAYPGNVKSGSLLLAMMSSSPDTLDPAVPTDTRSNIWTRIRREPDSSNGEMAVWWYAISNGAGADTVTMASGTNFDAYMISEFSVDAGTISLDQQTGQVQGSIPNTTDACTSGNITPSANTALIVGFCTQDGPDVTLTEGTNFANRFTTNLRGTPGNQVMIESRTLAVAAPVAATWTVSATARAINMVASFIATGGAAADTQTRRYQIRRSRMTSW